MRRKASISSAKSVSAGQAMAGWLSRSLRSSVEPLRAPQAMNVGELEGGVTIILS